MRLVIYLLFVLSGFVGLVYESIWSHYLKLLFGHSSYGQILTLIVFMGGIGLGSFIAGRIVPRIKNPFRAYAIVELVAGVGGLLFHRVFTQTLDFYFARIAAAEGIGWSGIYGLRIFLGSLVTLPIATLLGMTFPIIAVGLLRLTRDSGRNSFSLLYFCNSIGAAFGILVTSYFLVRILGTEATLLFAGTGNLVVAAGFYLISKRVGDDVSVPKEEEQAALEATAPADGEGKREIPLWLFVAFGTGFASFIYEIGWIRLLSLMLGSSTHSFDVMVSAFVFGLAFGGLFSKRLMRRSENIGLTMAVVQIAMGTFAFLTIYFYQNYFGIVNGLHDVLKRNDQTYVLYSVIKYGVALCVMFPACFCAGMTLPLITHFLCRKTGSEKFTGYVYGWNTLGGISGAVLGGLFLLPWLQLKWTIGFGAALDVLLGVLILTQVAAPKRARLLLYATAVLAIVPCFFVQFDAGIISAGTYRLKYVPVKLGAAGPEITVRHGRTATISFHETTADLALRTNGKADGMTFRDPVKSAGRISDDPTMAGLAYLPMITRNEPYDVAIIGMGTGLTLHYLLGDPLLRSVDLIEIEPEMIELAKKMGSLNERAFNDDRVNYIVADAKSYFYANRKTYDIIISEPSNPWVSGVSGLFTVEFYRHVQKFLKPGGSLVQWAHLYDFSDDLMLSILTALQEFEYFEIYGIKKMSDVIIFAGNQPVEFTGMDRLQATAEIRKDFEFRNWDYDHFGPGNYIVSSKTLAPVLDTFSSLANSDYYPYLDQHAERGFYKHEVATFLKSMDLGYSQYQELFEPKRHRDLKRNHAIKSPSERYKDQNDLLVRLADLRKEADWNSREQAFFSIARQLLPYGAWDDMEVVQRFRAAVEGGFVSEQGRLKFLALDCLAKDDTAGAVVQLEKLMAEMSSRQGSDFWIRCFAVNFVKAQRPDLYQAMYTKYVDGRHQLSIEERALVDALFVQLIQPNQPVGILPAQAE